MKEYEELLKKSIELKNAQNSINCMEIGPNERLIIEKLKDEHYITNSCLLDISCRLFRLSLSLRRGCVSNSSAGPITSDPDV